MTAIENAAKVETVTLTIDGLEVTVPKGTLIIRAAETVGINIPRFCDHPLLDPVGACRQCMVEVEMGGRPMPKPQASCTMEVSDGMVVKTQLTSEVAERAQWGMMELLLINHPLDCPVCDKGGECPLQNQAMSTGRADSRFIDRKRTYPKPVPISTEILLDRERCVLCARCTRFSQQIAGDPFIELFERGANEQVSTSTDEPFQSYFSGNTIQICPVGALTSADYRFRARPFDLQSSPGIDEHDSSGAAIRVDWRRGRVMRRLAGNDPEVNEEWISDRTRFAFNYAQSNERIMTPMVRDENGALVAASWPEALELAANGLRSAMQQGGVGVLPGGRLTAEDAYAYSKFARTVLGTNDIDARARAHSDEELEFLASHVAGVSIEDGAVTFADLDAASAVILVGLEPEEEAPTVFLRLRKAMRKRGLKIFALSPYTTRGLEKLGAAVISTTPGAEASVLAAIGDGTAGGAGADAADAVRAGGTIVLAGERLAEIPGALRAVSTLGAAGARLAWIPRRAGERGAIDAGALPSMLPGGRLVADIGARAELETVWGTSLPGEVGRDLNGILEATRSGDIAGLLIGGVDPFDLPDPELAFEAMKASKFVVSLEMLPTAATEWADVILPVAPVVEKSGTFINWEGRRRHFDLTMHSTGALSDARVLHQLADEMDADLGLLTPEQAMAEIDRLGGTTQRPAPATAGFAVPPQQPAAGSAILASWRQLVDLGTLQAGEVYLQGTARPSVARLSPATAAEIGAAHGEIVTVSTDRGAVSLPLAVTDMPDRVVWIPMNSPDSRLRRDLRAAVGEVVRIAAGGGAR
ncbi:NADH-quinone oxidoreductase subunit G [Blastococcus sp. Marseille-P5729]|uniref:NADH-quinone oxidoreductase subunit G n=1 Tax=Blastococcus sp. Marseille-P5729 TaxID=2086582 RepID=UPI000D0FDA83|nr:NADH-quinone oxidoreductase subunit G [Blastococcus sp. Marseille-P5729]